MTNTNPLVLFRRSCSPYTLGEMARFLPAKAKALVDGGFAVYTNPEDDGVAINRQTSTETAEQQPSEVLQEKTDDKRKPAPPPGKARQRGRNRQIITDK